MKRFLTGAAIMLLISSLALCQRRGFRGSGTTGQEYPPLARSDSERRILDTINQAVQAGEMYANVPAADGRILRLLAETSGAKSVVELGTSTGISGLWFSMALEKTGGRLTTFEIDPGRAATAAGHFRQAGVDKIVTIVRGDAHQNIKALKEPIDIVFIDAEKEGYIAYLNQLLPLVRPGGLILAHNADMVRDYVRTVAANRDLDTIFCGDGNGLAVTIKKR